MSNIALTLALFAAFAAPPTTPEIPLQRKAETPIDGQASKVIRAAVPDKQGRIKVVCPVASSMLDEKTFQGQKGSLLLQDPEPKVSMEVALKHPELRDRLYIRIAPAVVDRLKRLGIRDVAAYFQRRTVQATGKSTSVLYLCFPAIAVTTVVVERIEDIEVIGENDPAPNSNRLEEGQNGIRL